MAVTVFPPAATTLRDLVLKRLDADTKPEDEWSAFVLAALDGEEELTKLLDEGGRQAQRRTATKDSRGDAKDPDAPAIAFLKSITVEGFRGIGKEATLDLTPGPGLTLVVGRNGSGKSSFAEALELLLTGDTYRWAQRTKVWRDGWRNLHHRRPESTPSSRSRARRSACTVAREWARRPRPRSRHHLGPGPRQAPRMAGGARLGDAARRLSSLPLLQRARLLGRLRRARRSGQARPSGENL